MSNLKLERWFPTIIGFVDCPFLSDIYDSYDNKIRLMQFNKDGFSYTQIHLDNTFKRLNDWITYNVNEYAKAHKFPATYEAKESWLLNYPHGGGQPWHTHVGATISTVFYFDVKENDVGTRFRSPLPYDMITPLNLSPNNDGKSDDKFNELTSSVCNYSPVQGRLLIFRSHVEHTANNKETNGRRIVFSYNYGPTNEPEKK